MGSVVAVVVVGILVGAGVLVGIGVEKPVEKNVSVDTGVEIDAVFCVAVSVQEANPITKTTKRN